MKRTERPHPPALVLRAPLRVAEDLPGPLDGPEALRIAAHLGMRRPHQLVPAVGQLLAGRERGHPEQSVQVSTSARVECRQEGGGPITDVGRGHAPPTCRPAHRRVAAATGPERDIGEQRVQVTDLVVGPLEQILETARVEQPPHCPEHRRPPSHTASAGAL